MVDVGHTRAWVRDVVRSGLITAEQQYAEVWAAVAEDHPDLPAEQTARGWIEEAERGWREDAVDWSEETDYDRLQRVFGDLQERGLVVLQGCADHWAAKDLLTITPCRGVAWFTPADVWHAIDEAMLEVNLWHPTTANAAPGDALLNEVLGVFATNGLNAHFDEGRIEVTARWQRRPR